MSNSNIINFATREAIEVAKAHGIIEQQLKEVDKQILVLLYTVLEQSEELAEEDVCDVFEMHDALEAFFTCMIRSPKHYESYQTIKEWADNLQAYYETGGDDE